MNRHLYLLFWLLAATSNQLFCQNFKQILGPQVMTPLQIASGEYITYLIRFQNFGGDTSQNLSIRDTLDPRLDATTFEMLDASHAHTVIRGGEVIRWYFNDISLPTTAVNEPSAKGYISFRIKPKKDLVAGQVIRNRAFIYFDDQPIVPTNEAVVWIDDSGPATGPNANSISLFPNPNAGVFETNINAADESDPNCVITDASGKATPFNATETNSGEGSIISLGSVESGVYFLQTKIDGVIRVFPFVVVK